MTSAPTPSSDASGDRKSHNSDKIDPDGDVTVDLRDVFQRLCKGLAQILGFAVLGAAIAAAIGLLISPFVSTTTSMRVAFAFTGYARGEYPDHSKFQPDDIRSPDIISEALKKQGLENGEGFASKVRAALTVEGLIPANVIKERDRLRAAGQTISPYIPDEYLLTLTLPRNAQISIRQRELLLNEVVNTYTDRFRRTYAEIPMAFGNAFESLRAADYYEYELVLNSEVQSITAYLVQELDQAKTFRSPVTNLSFSDLISQTELFSQIRLYETLGFIRQNGLSRNRNIALVKIDYHLLTLEDQEQKAIEDERVVNDLLAKSQDRSQNYVLGIKSQAAQPRPESPILDQGLIDSLLANDANNFLLRQALTTGLKVKSIHAEKEQLLERRKDIEAFLNRNAEDQSALFAQVQKSLADLEVSYRTLVSNINKTQADFARQQFADAIRISMRPMSASLYRPVITSSMVGAFIGTAFGMGLSLIGVYIGSKKAD